MLDRKEYFRLDALLKFLNDSIDKKQGLGFQSFVDNAFNRNEESLNDMDTLLKYYDSNLPDSINTILEVLRGDCTFKTFQYAKAAQTDSVLLSRYKQSFDSGKVSDMKNYFLMYNALKDISPQRTTITDSAVIHWKKDKLGLIEIPVKCNSSIYSCIFDTRANISSISQTFATKIGLEILPVSYEEGSCITGIRFKTGLGVADSL